MVRSLKLIVTLIVVLLAACQASAVDTTNAVRFNLSSPAFQDSGLIGRVYTCQGENRSPELNWSAAPGSTRSFVLIVEDPDAPGGTFTHWVLFDIPASAQQLPENSTLGTSGNNGLGKTGYMGPCPPGGIHRYYFRLYALDVPSLNLPAGASRSQVEAAMKGHVIGAADTMSRYEQQ